jgi:uncharacterized protein (DUF1684 family)
MNQLKEFRTSKDQFYKTNPQSPLTSEQKRTFKGLSYFPENPALRFELPVEEFPQKTKIMMQTSTGDTQEYTHFGKVRFEVDGKPAELTIYAGEHDFFLPFIDSLAGTETYEAGRYLDPILVGDGKFLIDFNYAYNPYCIYNDRWSCPLTPSENRLKVPIQAGEKLFQHEAHPISS